MNKTVLTLALVAFAAAASADDDWVSVGATRVVAPASSSPVDTTQRNFSPSIPQSVATPAADNTLVSELLTQIEQMQEEIAMLRGRVEEQDNQIQTIQQEQQDRYLDLDRRIAALMVADPVIDDVPKATTSGSNIVPPTTSVTPSDAYKAAMTLVREKKFSEAGAAFDAFVSQYPSDPLVPNARYWSGEVNLVGGQLDRAAERFRTVISDFPDSAKAADAAYKLGVTMHRKGNDEQARIWLQQVIDRYTGRADGTVSLAKSYLGKIGQKTP
ncbi:tol-pal system protein YbgF [Thalassolituus sp.]|mgnify:FL=1|uniref:tol-pal system protein YbgF n=1 Tax=Thalassolituus sp. TaxID=2030822 RepID=UPI002A813259|nr:tol-pal system protein YbgF [Thalassolituus sp.]